MSKKVLVVLDGDLLAFVESWSVKKKISLPSALIQVARAGASKQSGNLITNGVVKTRKQKTQAVKKTERAPNTLTTEELRKKKRKKPVDSESYAFSVRRD